MVLGLNIDSFAKLKKNSFLCKGLGEAHKAAQSESNCESTSWNQARA